VHRNWLAVTDSLPRALWYVDATSPNATLDYPPLFAWFEWGLGRVARWVLPKDVADDVLRLQAEPFASTACVLFQRLTVVATGSVLAAVAWWASAEVASPSLLFFLITCNAGLIMVDNVHFQYNGVLLALLLVSVLLVERRRSFVLASVAFAALLNAKHLFAYAAPAFFVYLLRVYVFADEATTITTKLTRLAALGAAVVGTFAASLLPFYGSLQALASRLFPFGRGLLHAYWAPNAWALYAAVDKVLALAGLGGRSGKTGASFLLPKTANMSGGIVGVAEFAVLPQVGPRATAVVTLVAMLPALLALWRGRPRAQQPRPQLFTAAVAHCLLCGFMFGYHVHEKAVLTFLVPMALVVVVGAAREKSALAPRAAPFSAADFVLASTAGHVGIFPLLFRPQELVLRWALVAFYFVVAAWGLREAGEEGEGRGEGRRGAGKKKTDDGASSSWRLVYLYACGCALLEAFNVVAATRLAPNLPFLPLLLTSVWCAWPLALVWARATVAWGREAVGA
jgi:alpha-1,3-glucosyltransferase